MAVALRSSSVSGTSDTNDTSCTVPVPSGAAAGDIALLAMEHWETFDATGITWPTGFTVIPAVNGVLSGAREKLYVAWKRLTGADTGNYVITWTSAQWNMGHCILITGAVATGDPVEASNTATGTGTTIPGTSVTTVTEPFLAHFVANEDTASGTPPTNFTEARDGDYLKTNYRIPAATGTHTVSGGSTSASSAKSVALIAIKADSGGGSVSGVAVASLGGLAATATGLPTVGGTASAPLGALAASAVGLTTVTAVAAAAFGTLTASTSGLVQVSAVAGAPLGALAATASGAQIEPGTASATLGGLSANASGATTVTATATASLGVLVASASGLVTVSAVATATLGALAASGVGSGVGGGSGIATANFAALAATANGGVTVTAAAVAALGALTAQAAGLHVVNATAIAQLGSLVASANGSTFVAAAASAVLGALTAMAVVQPPVTRGGSTVLARTAANTTATIRTAATATVLDRRSPTTRGGT